MSQLITNLKCHILGIMCHTKIYHYCVMHRFSLQIILKTNKFKPMNYKKEIERRLKNVKYPGYSRDIVSFGFIKSIKVEKGEVEIHLRTTTVDEVKRKTIVENIKKELKNLTWIKELRIVEEISEKDQFIRQKLRGVKNTVVVSSAKGGVGKSFVSVNIAYSLSLMGYKTGIMDADVFGPSVPIMLGLKEKPTSPDGINIVPVIHLGIEIMSLGLLLKPDDPVIWRGPMVMKLMDQFFNNVLWNNRDIVIIDLPPGTGDVQLSMAQNLEIDGAIIVTTPQKVAMQDVKRGINMFRKLNIKILGIVENMSYLVCPHCGKQVELFPGKGTSEIEKEFGINIIGRLPLEPQLSQSADSGKLPSEALPNSSVSAEIHRIAKVIKNEVLSNNKS